MKFLIIGIIALFVFNCVPPNQQTISHKIKYVAPKEYDKESVDSFISQLDKNFKSPGFRGLHTGMTMDDINSLVKHTPWGYKFKPTGFIRNGNSLDRNWPDFPQTKESNFIINDKSKLGYTWANIGCAGTDGKGSCYWINQVYIQYYQGKLAAFSLQSPKWSANKIDSSLKPWAYAALKGLSSKYGPPITVKHIGKVNIFDFKDGFSTRCYLWDLGDHKIDLRIGCYEHEYYSLVKFADSKADSQIKSQGKELKTNF